LRTSRVSARDLEVLGRVLPAFTQVLAPDALAFVRQLADEFEPRRLALLDARRERQRRLDAGEMPGFLPETAAVRHGDWHVAPIPPDLLDRRVEITGPVDRKMIINALNSGANVFMADFEDSTSPTWHNVVQGQMNLSDAVGRRIYYVSPDRRQYRLNDRTAVLMVRPRGWHLHEKHVALDGRPISATLFDFGLFLFHNARRLLERGSGPYFYLPKLESHLEARLWHDVFQRSEALLGIPHGSIRATVLIETILAAFEMDEILYELRDYSAGLNCGRWDYLFSIIKKFRGNPAFTLPDRDKLSMTQPFMRAYSLLAIKTCHRRGIHAMGGMAAHIPIKDDPSANEAAFARVREDKEREAGDGHDGTWVAHPGLVGLARSIFDEKMPGPNQIERLREDVVVDEGQLLAMPGQAATERGLRHNVDVGVRYMAAWLSGNGSVPIYNLMEDAATAEISRSQVWQLIHHPNGVLDDGRKVDSELARSIFAEVSASLEQALGASAFRSGRYDLARQLIEEIALRPEFTDFMTTVGYDHLD
jgi:malate synthase